jgi:hypothetical protein
MGSVLKTVSFVRGRLPVFEVQPDRILDVAHRLIVGAAFAIAALEGRAGDKEAVGIAFDDDRQRVVPHADIVLWD